MNELRPCVIFRSSEEAGIATHSSILVTYGQRSHRIQSIGSKRVGYN